MQPTCECAQFRREPSERSEAMSGTPRSRLEAAQCIDASVNGFKTEEGEKRERNEHSQHQIPHSSPMATRKSYGYDHENKAAGALLLLGVDLLLMIGQRACRVLSCINSEFCLWDAWKVKFTLNQSCDDP